MNATHQATHAATHDPVLIAPGLALIEHPDSTGLDAMTHRDPAPWLRLSLATAALAAIGSVIALLGLRMALAQRPWVPERFKAHVLPARFLPKLLLVTSRMFGRLEKLLKPRLFYPEYPAAFQRTSGVIILACGLLLLLPLP